jgi:integrase
MSIYKRKGAAVWWIQLTTPDGRRIQQSARTTERKAAQELHDTIKAEFWRQKHLKHKPRRKWQEAVTHWLTESAHKRSLEEDRKILRWLHPFLFDIFLDDIDREQVEAIRQAKLDGGASPLTANRTLALLRAILNRAVKDWEWLDKAPLVRMSRVEAKRIRWLSHDEAERLLAALPPHLAEMVRFSLATGVRESNVTGLQWSQIDLPRRCAWIHADQAKGKRSFAVPLNEDALACIRRQIGKHAEFVFTYRGEPVTRANNHAWRNALKRSGVEDFRWHDLRHTWASWHVQNGTPLHVLQELGGWSDFSMVQRYAHLSPAHLAEYAGNLEKQPTKLLRLVK